MGNLTPAHAPASEAGLLGLLERAGVHDAHGRHREALEIARQAVTLAQSCGHDRMRVQALNLKALQLLRLGANEDCVSTAQEAGELSERLGMLSSMSAALATRTMGLIELGLHGEALATVSNCLDAAERAEDDLRLCWGLNRAGCVHHYMGDTGAAVDKLEQSLTLARALDDREALYAALNNLCEAMVAHVKQLQRHGQTKAAQRALERGIECSEEGVCLARQIGSKYQELMVQGNLGMLLGLQQPQNSKSRQMLEDALCRAEESGYRPMALMLRKYLACLDRLQNNPDAAIPRYQDLLRHAADHNDRAQALEVHLELSETLQQAGRDREALDHFQHYHRLQQARRDEVADTRVRMLARSTGAPYTAAPAQATSTMQDLSRAVLADKLKVLRAVLVFGVVMYAGFVFLDLNYLSDQVVPLLANRAMVLSLSLLVLAATFLPGFERKIPEALAVLHLVVGTGCLHLGVVFPGYMASLYCAMIFFSVLPQARPLYLGTVNAALVLGFIAIHIFRTSPSLSLFELSFHAVLLGTAAVVLQLGLYLREVAAQREQVRNVQLQAASNELERTQEIVTRQFQELERRHKELDADLKLACSMQQRFLPQGFEGIAGLRIRGYYRPMAQVGGDYYDVIPLPDGRTALLVGDVSGHGVTASLITAMVKITCAMHSQAAATPGALLRAMSRTLVDNTGHHFLTLFAAFVDADRRRVQFANAGQCLPLLRRAASGEVEELGAAGMLLGLFESDDYPDHQTELAPGDRLLFYTDGVTEARDGKRQMYGNWRLAQIFRDRHDGDADALVSWLIEDLETFRGGYVFDDDIALLCVDVLPNKES